MEGSGGSRGVGGDGGWVVKGSRGSGGGMAGWGAVDVDYRPPTFVL